MPDASIIQSETTSTTTSVAPTPLTRREHEYTDILVVDSMAAKSSLQQQQQKQQILTPTTTQSTSSAVTMTAPIIPVVVTRKSANEDDMQRLVAYINQFEQDSNSSIRVAAAKSEQHLAVLPIVDCQQEDLPSSQTNQQQQQQQPDPTIKEVVVGIVGSGGDTSSKLRLSSSSLSSSDVADDNDSIAGSNDCCHNKDGEMEEVVSVDDENGDMMVEGVGVYEELEDVCGVDEVGGRKEEGCAVLLKRDQIDRRTYIVNKLYDNLGEDAAKSNIKEEHKTVFPIESDDQYEKVRYLLELLKILNNSNLRILVRNL